MKIKARKIVQEATDNEEQQENKGEQNYDKALVLSNIRGLLKTSDKGLGFIEEKAGFNPGYVARLEKPGNTTEPSLNFIATAAKYLNVSIDYLVKAPVVDLTPTEKYLLGFLDKLNKETLDYKLDWEIEYQGTLNRMTDSGKVEDWHPLYSYNTFYVPGEADYPEQESRTVFTSHAYDCNTYIAGDCFNLRLKNGARLYLMNAAKAVGECGEFDTRIIEVWMAMPDNTTRYLCADYDTGDIGKAVTTLYTSVKTYMKHPTVKKDLAYIIDSFMKDDMEDDADENDMPDSFAAIDPDVPF